MNSIERTASVGRRLAFTTRAWAFATIGVGVGWLGLACDRPSQPGPLKTGGGVSDRVAVGSRRGDVPRVSPRPGNVEGKVLVVEYHKIARREARWDRSIVKFKSDLDRFYHLGFRPVTVSEYLDDKMPLAPGASPIVFTFDDADPSQLRFASDGSIDPDCAVGIWQEFTKAHPDFPLHATFFVLPDTMWGQHSMLDRKIQVLKDAGSELASHTITHPKLSHLSDEAVKREIGDSLIFLAKYGFQNVSLALPFGISPKHPEIMEGFEWKGSKYSVRAAFLTGAEPAPPPKSVMSRRMRIPRIQGIDEPYGIKFWLDKLEAGDFKVYVQP